ncbi:MAG: hypothetical protein JWR47_2706 [Phenylobacterium sp.]|nr:hypothetical protein [Phenylobacterium sp.]
MSATTETTEHQDRALAELLELGMAAAREVQARLLAAEDAKAVCDLSLAFNRVSRAVRQTVALQAKVGRERRREGRDEAAEGKRADEAHASRRQLQVRTAVERRIWAEAEDDEAERLIDELDDLVSEEALYEGFGQEPVAAHIARICGDLGLRVPPPLGKVAPKATEGASAADSQQPVLSGPPQSLRDSSPVGGATAWRSSA